MRADGGAALAGPGALGRSRLRGRLLERERLDARTRAAMLALLCAHFRGVDARVFERDLADKDRVLLLEDEAGELVGFTTLALFTTTGASDRARILVSGDTIVRRSAWGSPELARAWIDAVRVLHPFDDPNGERLWWLLLTSGFRTYRFLPVFWRAFWPRFDAPTPSFERALLERAARERWGERYFAELGVVRLERPQVLRGSLLELPPARRGDPHVAFFARENPGWVRGDELACLCELSPANLTAAGRRVTFGERALR